MKKQSGFTLIELLLVLAIIGIISAIAIPALLSQRARARDKASIDNMVGRVGDMVGQYDKLREAGSTAFATRLTSYINATAAGDKNPWNPSQPAYSAVTNVAGTTKSTFETALKANGTVLGQAAFGIQVPTNGVGFIGGVVLVQNVINGSTKVVKSVAIE